MTGREIRMYRRQHGLCTKCGRDKENLKKAWCDTCRAAGKKYDGSHARKLRQRNNSIHTDGYSISEVCRMAEKRGISYGQMTMLLDTGKDR